MLNVDFEPTNKIRLGTKFYWFTVSIMPYLVPAFADFYTCKFKRYLSDEEIESLIYELIRQDSRLHSSLNIDRDLATYYKTHMYEALQYTIPVVLVLLYGSTNTGFFKNMPSNERIDLAKVLRLFAFAYQPKNIVNKYLADLIAKLSTLNPDLFPKQEELLMFTIAPGIHVLDSESIHNLLPARTIELVKQETHFDLLCPYLVKLLDGTIEGYINGYPFSTTSLVDAFMTFVVVLATIALAYKPYDAYQHVLTHYKYLRRNTKFDDSDIILLLASMFVHDICRSECKYKNRSNCSFKLLLPRTSKRKFLRTIIRYIIHERIDESTEYALRRLGSYPAIVSHIVSIIEQYEDINVDWQELIDKVRYINEIVIRYFLESQYALDYDDLPTLLYTLMHMPKMVISNRMLEYMLGYLTKKV